MYVAENIARIKGRSYTSVLLMQSYRDQQRRPRRRTLANLSKLPPELVELIRSYCQKKTLARADTLRVIWSRNFAGLAVLDYYWKKLDLDAVLGVVGEPWWPRLKAMIWQRLLDPASKRKLKRWARDSALGLFLELEENYLQENRLYDAMDALLGHWASIEKKLYGRRSQPPELLLYDLTSSYFEGVRVKRARFGYSRDHRSDRRQIVIGVVKDEKGVPLTVELLRGDRADVTTVSQQMLRLKKRFGIEQAIYVGDQGTVSQANLKFLREEQGLDYLICLKRQSMQPLLQRAGESIQLGLFDEKGWQSFAFEGKRYVLCHSPQRGERDRKKRAARLAKGREKLQQLQDQVSAGRLKREQKMVERATRILSETKSGPYFRYWIEKGQFHFQPKDEKIQSEQALDGKYLLVCTRQQLEPPQMVSHYRDLRLVEWAFRVFKSDLEFRPVFHWKDRRVQAHLYLVFLAYWLERQIELEWNEKGFRHRVCEVLRYLNGIRLQKIEMKPLPMPIYRLVDWDPEREQIAQTLGLKKIIEKAIPVSHPEPA